MIELIHDTFVGMAQMMYLFLVFVALLTMVILCSEPIHSTKLLVTVTVRQLCFVSLLRPAHRLPFFKISYQDINGLIWLASGTGINFANCLRLSKWSFLHATRYR